MNIKVFDINEGKITVNESCLLIPELKVICEEYKDPIPVLCFVHFMTDPLSPYANLGDDKKLEVVLEDYPGEYTMDDEPVFKAMDKLIQLYETPTMRLLKKARIGLETLGDYLGTASISDGKDGNSATFQSALKSIGKISQEFKALEREVEEELQVRGGSQIGYDEI